MPFYELNLWSKFSTITMVRNKPGRSSSLEAQINERGALLLLSTVTSLVGKAGEAAKRTGPRSSS